MESGNANESEGDGVLPLEGGVQGSTSSNDYELFQTQLVATRRLQWDLLLWQAPTLALTGQAFLFSIALDGARSQFSRIVSSCLLVLISLSSLHTLSGHRVSELTDAKLLQEFESSKGLRGMFGTAFRDQRKELVASQRKLPSRNFLIDRWVAHVMRIRSITVWFLTMTTMFLVSCLVLFVSCFFPHLV
jgi:hypothetical protein